MTRITDPRPGARAILSAGCGGVPSLVWLLDSEINCRVPPYSAGDAQDGNPSLYDAVEYALTIMATEVYPGEPGYVEATQ